MGVGAEEFAELQELHGQLLRWLRSEALPLWETHGVDRVNGGYFEVIAYDPVKRAFEARGETRRGRVVARQMFVFHAGRALGWEASGPDPLLHGCEYLFAHLKRDDGHFHTAIDAQSRLPSGEFSLYESAFYLFALAKVHGSLADSYPIYDTAHRFLDLLRDGWGKANGGFDESRPASVPLKSNPHMHLFEAALAWIEATQAMPLQQAIWLALATEIVELALTKFVDPRSGAVREYFDESWAPMTGDSGRLIEPGHQFEWSWLLLRWAECRHCPEHQVQTSRVAARTLVGLGERFGVDAVRGVAINELWDNMTPKDTSAKLWPQTERIKAWSAMAEDAATAQERDSACRNLRDAIRGLQRYLDLEPAGLWQEVLFADGEFSREPSKASSFYHIVSAIETLDQCMTALQK